ncbi:MULTISPECIES: hypothetical protein [Marinobacter]|jgi:hypothetical protein|uniref:hypothetical protein n=1 Tax=Marinobacter TaxID=2742 RepID=UPI0011600D98|nr:MULTISPECIES: hypothetical protein [Marinobacter]|tara:strand:+ start:3266 stop:3661 length:396 start_codon:yes stop_codon:yes gene_type:complete
MDSAMYTLIGALGGVFLTQLANYFLEDKRSKNQRSLKRMELDSAQGHDLLTERRIAYSRYLSDLDFYVGGKNPELSDLMPSFYSALILSESDASEAIIQTLRVARDSERSAEDLMEVKKKVLEEMKNDLQH